MKHFFSLLIGCLAALFVTFTFSACNNDKSDASMDSRLVGVWEWLYQDYGYNYTLTVNADHTGSLAVTSQNVSGSVAQATFSWKSLSENMVRLVIESGNVPGMGGEGNRLDFEVEFYGSDRLIFTMTEAPYTSFGAFTRVAGAPSDGGSPKQKLVGTWKLTEWKDSDTQSFVPWQDVYTTFTLTAAGTYTSVGYFGTGNGTYTLNGNALTFYYAGTTPLATATITSLTNSELIANVDGDTYLKFVKI